MLFRVCGFVDIKSKKSLRSDAICARMTLINQCRVGPARLAFVLGDMSVVLDFLFTWKPITQKIKN